MYRDDLIKGRVSKAVKNRTKENMERYNMGLYDAFKEAVRSLKVNKKLNDAWYHDDFREYIPSAYLPEYLDFSKYPLKY